MNNLKDNWFLADIGATSSRFAIYQKNTLNNLMIFKNNDFSNPIELLKNYLNQINVKTKSCAIGIASPVNKGKARMINKEWQLDHEDIVSLGFKKIEIINDFQAISYALPNFIDTDRIEIGRAKKYRTGNIGVLGPGTGLGMAAWIYKAGPMSGEGGHITLSARNSEEEKIICNFRKIYGHCSAERVLSGPGILALHRVMHGEDFNHPKEITNNLNNKNNKKTMDQWFLFLGSVAAELALITGAIGGIYIAGGIIPKYSNTIIKSGFRNRFEDKNRYKEYMKGIPTWIIKDPNPGLKGLISFIKNYHY